MNKLLGTFKQYQHYLVLMSALVLANYVVVPLSEWQLEQQQTHALVAKQSNKIEHLIANKTSYAEQLNSINQQLDKITAFVFTDADEAKFKLSAQSNIEKILNTAECSIERIDFKGDTLVLPTLSRWRVELRFTGDAMCLTQTTRGLETMTPSAFVEDYNFNHRGFTGEAKGTFNAIINVNLWHSKEVAK